MGLNIKAKIEVTNDLKDKIEALKQDSKKRILSNDDIKANLSKAYKEGDLVIVLGAGVSKAIDMPDWITLIKELLIEILKVESDNYKETLEILSNSFLRLFDNNPLITAGVLENYINSNDDLDISKILKEILYENIDYDKKPTETMKALVELCSNDNYTLDSIITYNYDDIIEKVFKGKLDFQTIYKEHQNVDDDKLHIYHVHGYLPESKKLDSSYINNLVFSETSYHKQYSEVYNWNNITQINKFKNKTCLFIGLSLTDPNLRRLLDISNNQKPNNSFHYVITEKPNLKNEIIEIENLFGNDFNSNNVRIYNEFRPEKYFENINEIKIIMDSLSYIYIGLQPFWVEDFDIEIPKLLRSIRQS